MKDQVQDYAKRAERYQNIDGVTELALGFASVCATPFFWRMANLPKGFSLEPLAWMYGYCFIVILLTHYGTNALRKHTTHPRTGYAKPRSGNPWQILFYTGLWMGLMLVARYDAFFGKTLLAMVFPAGYAWGIARLDPRKWPVVIVQVLGLVAISMLPADLYRSFQRTPDWPLGIQYRYLALYTAFFGLTVLISGGITLYLYIRRTKPPAGEGE